LAHARFVDRFHERHPGIRLQFVLADRYIDLSKGEADVALRSGDTEGELVGRKIADSIWAIYASRDYVARNGAPQSVEDLKALPLIAFDQNLANHRLSLWLKEIAPNANYAVRSNSVLALVSSTKAGVGVAALPIALGDAEPELIRVLGPFPELTRAWRVLAHPDARHRPRVADSFDFAAPETDALGPILIG
jgi:DNA-binding transcriptional LysR family regulator